MPRRDPLDPRDRDLPPELRGSHPGPRSLALADRLGRLESRNVTYRGDGFPIFWARAEGSNVWDVDGNRYVDLSAGFAVAAVGHGHPRVIEAIRSQAGELVHGMGDVHPAAVKVELLERLAALAPVSAPRAVLGTSGAEAVEVALKTACLLTGKPGALCFTAAYHGLTYGALSVTDRAYFRAPFEAQLNPHVLRAPYPHPFRPPEPLESAPDLAAAALTEVERILDTERGSRVGAVLLEPIQGRGGDVVPPAGFLRGVAEMCERRGVLLILDEIYTGLGRAGSRFACDEESVSPDILCVGKALSGGMPIAACLGSEEVMDAWPRSRGEAMHTSTFMAHPIACAAALAALEVIREEGLVERSRELGRRWIRLLDETLDGRPGVGEVRGRGLMIGIDLVRDGDHRTPDPGLAGRVVRSALRVGWILLTGGPDGNVLSLSPPLNVEWGSLERAAEMLGAVVQSCSGDRG